MEGLNVLSYFGFDFYRKLKKEKKKERRSEDSGKHQEESLTDKSCDVTSKKNAPEEQKTSRPGPSDNGIPEVVSSPASSPPRIEDVDKPIDDETGSLNSLEMIEEEMNLEDLMRQKELLQKCLMEISPTPVLEKPAESSVKKSNHSSASAPQPLKDSRHSARDEARKKAERDDDKKRKDDRDKRREEEKRKLRQEDERRKDREREDKQREDRRKARHVEDDRRREKEREERIERDKRRGSPNRRRSPLVIGSRGGGQHSRGNSPNMSSRPGRQVYIFFLCYS